MIRIGPTAALLAAACFLVSCGGPDTTGTAVDSVVITAPSTTLVIGQSEALVAVATGAGHAVSGANVSWSSSDPSVASVDANGLVVAIKGGTTQIVATAAGKTDAVQLTVNNPAPAIGSLVIPPRP